MPVLRSEQPELVIGKWKVRRECKVLYTTGSGCKSLEAQQVVGSLGR